MSGLICRAAPASRRPRHMTSHIVLTTRPGRPCAQGKAPGRKAGALGGWILHKRSARSSSGGGIFFKMQPPAVFGPYPVQDTGGRRILCLTLSASREGFGRAGAVVLCCSPELKNPRP